MTETAAAAAASFNWADYAIMAIIVLSILISFSRGFIKEALSLTTWIVAIFISVKFYIPLSSLLTEYVATPSLRKIIAFGVLFISTLIIGGTINFLLGHIIVKTGLSGPNRLLGAAFGFIRGILIIGIIVLLGRYTTFVEDDWWKTAMLIPYAERVADGIHKILPDKVHQIGAILTSKHLTSL